MIGSEWMDPTQMTKQARGLGKRKQMSSPKDYNKVIAIKMVVKNEKRRILVQIFLQVVRTSI